MTWLLACVSLAATVMNIRRVRLCFLLWIATNLSWAVADVIYGMYARAPLDLIYAFLAIWGWFAWGRDQDRRPTTS